MAKRNKNPKDPGYFFVNTGRGNFPVQMDSQMHRDLYNAGRLMTYDENRDQYVAPTLPEFTVSAKRNKGFWEQYIDKMLEEAKGADIAGTIFGVPLNMATSLPQMALTKLFTGTMQRPSEAMDIQNPIGAVLTDIVLDPISFGPGLFTKGARLGAKAATLGSRAANAAEKAALARLAASKESGLLSNAYKLNPRAFKPDPEAYYRGIGKAGLDDAIESGVLRTNRNPSWTSSPGDSPYFFSGKNFKGIKQYEPNVIAEVVDQPMRARTFSKLAGSGDQSVFQPIRYTGEKFAGINIIEKLPNIPLGKNVKFYKKDWLRGYKPVELPKSSTTTDVGSTAANIAETSALNKLKIGVISAAEDVPSAIARPNSIVDNISSAANSGANKFDEALYEAEKQRILKLLTNYSKENYTPEAFQSGLPLEEGVPEAQRVVSDFLERISTREGKRRLKNLGIRNTNVKEDLFKRMKIFAEPSVDGAYSPTQNVIKMSPKYTKGIAGPIARHELEHAINWATSETKVPHYGWTSDEGYFRKLFSSDLKSVIGSDLRNLHLMPWDKLSEQQTRASKLFRSSLDEAMRDPWAAHDYFNTVRPRDPYSEKAPFLAEIQQYMMDRGIIPSKSYTNITPEMMQATWTTSRVADPMHSQLRLFNIMQPSDKNFGLLASNLNKMLGVAPLGVAAYQGLNNKQQ